MKWITNCMKDEADDYIRDLQLGQKGRRLFQYKPKATAYYSSEDLRRMGVVGVYEPEQSKSETKNSSLEAQYSGRM